MRSPDIRTLRRPCSSGRRRYDICLAKSRKRDDAKLMGAKAPRTDRAPPRGTWERSVPCLRATPARPPEFFASANQGQSSEFELQRKEDVLCET